MKTVKLEYTVENIQKAFHHFAKNNNDPSRAIRHFSIETDTVTIAHRETRREEFVNWLCYDYSECDRLTITIYDQYAKDSTKYVFDMAAARKRHDLAERNQQLSVEIENVRDENDFLRSENSKLEKENDRLDDENEDLEDDNEALRRENEKLADENRLLKTELEHERGKTRYEKLTGSKTIDAGEFVVHFISKKEEAQAWNGLFEIVKKQFAELEKHFQSKNG